MAAGWNFFECGIILQLIFYALIWARGRLDTNSANIRAGCKGEVIGVLMKAPCLLEYDDLT